MNDEIKKEVRNLERKLKNELSASKEPIPLELVAKEIQKSDSEAERYINMIREVNPRSPTRIVKDKSGRKCVGLKISAQQVRFRKPQ